MVNSRIYGSITHSDSIVNYKLLINTINAKRYLQLKDSIVVTLE